MSPAEECRTAAATLRRETTSSVVAEWITGLPMGMAESLAVILDTEVDLATDPRNHAEIAPPALAFARKVNGSKP